MYPYYLCMFLCCLSLFGVAQIEYVQQPTLETHQQIKPNQSYSQVNTQLPEESLIREQTPPSQHDIMLELEQKKKTWQYQQLSDKQKQNLELQYILAEERAAERTAPASVYSYATHGKFRFANYKHPDYTSSISLYENAFRELNNMLVGESKTDIKKAIYEIENIFYKGTLPYDKFTEAIQYLKHIVELIGKKYKLDLSKKVSLHFAIQKLYSDTIYDPLTKRNFYPFRYDFNDIYGEQSYDQGFVTKLLITGKGQCHSLPLLYKILAEEFNITAYLSYSPNHSYIQFKDEQNQLYNYETTNAMLTTQAWITGSGYIKSEAIKNKIYTDTVNNQKLLAQFLVELATMYKHHLGYDDFMEKCITTSLEYYPNNIYAHLEKSNLATAKTDKALFDANCATMEELAQKYPQQYLQLQELMAMYDAIDDMGYYEMPKEVYETWLKSLEDEKQKQESNELRIKLKFNELDR